MSARATFWAWKQRGLSASEKLVLLCLSDCHNSSTERCDPSVSYIADNTGLHRETVMKAIESTKEKGFISVEKRQGKRTNFFLKIVDTVQETSTEIPTTTSTENQTGTEMPTGTENQTGTSTENHTTPVGKTGHEPIKNLQINLKDKYKGLEYEYYEGLSTDSVKEYVDFRIKLKKPLTQNALNRFLKKIQSAHSDQSIPFTADQAIEKAIDSGWQGFELDWLKNRANQSFNQQAPTPNRRPVPKAGTER